MSDGSRGDRRRGPHRAHRRDAARPVRRRVPDPRALGVDLSPAPRRRPRRRGPPHPGAPRAPGRVRRDLPAAPGSAPPRPEHAGAGRVPARHGAGPARLPRGEHVRPTGTGDDPPPKSRAARHRHAPWQRRGHRADPGRQRGAGRRHRHRHGRARVRPGGVRPGVRRCQQPVQGLDRRRHAGPGLHATLARRRRGRPRPTSASGRACTSSPTRPAPAPTCGSGRPATAGSSS